MMPVLTKEGWEGWDQYAPFYDWENRRTLGRRDVPFWRRIALAAGGPVLELGCGTGRVSAPLAAAGVRLVGVDRSASMLARARRQWKALRRGRAGRARAGRVGLVRADIRTLPFTPGGFRTAIAPYGVLQSLLSDRDLAATLRSVARVLARGGTFGIDLVPDVPNWREYTDRVQLRGRTPQGATLTLIESVRQNRRDRSTTFDQRFVERRGRRRVEHRFELTFRTVSVQQMRRRLEGAGFVVDAVLGDYDGRPWDPRADVWIIVARRR